MLSCAPSRTRTYGLLLRRHSRIAVTCGQEGPDVPLSRSRNGWMWLCAALELWSLAPR